MSTPPGTPPAMASGTPGGMTMTKAATTTTTSPPTPEAIQAALAMLVGTQAATLPKPTIGNVLANGTKDTHVWTGGQPN